MISFVKSASCSVFVSLFLHSLFLVGTMKALGVFYEDIATSLRCSNTRMGIAFGCFNCFCAFSAPMFTVLYQRCLHRRIVLLCGAVSATLSIILIAFVSTSWQLIVLLAISGLGHNIIIIYLTVMLHHLELSKFNLLYGLATCGFSLGMVLIPLMADFLLKAYGWRGGMLVFGALKAHLIPSVLAIRIPQGVDSISEKIQMTNKDSPSRKYHSASPSPSSSPILGMGMMEQWTVTRGKRLGTQDDDVVPDDVEAQGKEEKNRLVNKYKQQTCSLLNDTLQGKGGVPKNLHSVHGSAAATHSVSKPASSRSPVLHEQFKRMLQSIRKSDFFLASDPGFFSMYLSMVMLGYIYSGWQSFLVPHALQRGNSLHRTVLITFTAAIGNLAGRASAGILTHRLITAIDMYIIMCFVLIAGIVCDVFFTDFYWMLVTSLVSSLAIASVSTLAALTFRERALPEYFPVAFAGHYICLGVGSILGGVSSGLVADRFSTFDATFEALAVVSTLNLLFMLPPKWIKKAEKEKENV